LSTCGEQRRHSPGAVPSRVRIPNIPAQQPQAARGSNPRSRRPPNRNTGHQARRSRCPAFCTGACRATRSSTFGTTAFQNTFTRTQSPGLRFPTARLQETVARVSGVRVTSAGMPRHGFCETGRGLTVRGLRFAGAPGLKVAEAATLPLSEGPKPGRFLQDMREEWRGHEADAGPADQQGRMAKAKCTIAPFSPRGGTRWPASCPARPTAAQGWRPFLNFCRNQVVLPTIN